MFSTHLKQLPPFLFFAFLLSTLSLQSCGSDELTNYHDRLIGEWQLSNAGDLQPFYNDKPFILKSATMIFGDDETVETRIMDSKDPKKWIVNTGTWSVTQSSNANKLVKNETITIKSDTGPFDDSMYISFIDERTFFIAINELEYEFVKL